MTRVFDVRVLFWTCLLVWINYLLGLSNMFLLDILELRKDIGASVLPTGSILYANVTFFESVPYFSPHSLLPALESIFPPLSVSLPDLTHVSDVSSPVSQVHTIEQPASKHIRNFSTSTLVDKKFLTLNEF